MSTTPRTIIEKVWDDHLVRAGDAENPDLLFVDMHLVHEVTSPQAFDGLRVAGRPVRRPDLTLAVMDHNVPTDTPQVRGLIPLRDKVSALQMQTLTRNCEEFGIELYEMGARRNGIVHIVGPEQGITQPGMVIVCGDSHTATHGAFGALAFGIGTSEVEHVLATQTLRTRMPKTFKVEVNGQRPVGVEAKDVVLAILNVIGTAGGTGHIIEYAGETIRDLEMEERMTVCNMSIEGGARAGLIAPDETTFAYLKDRPFAPKGADWDAAVAAWRELGTDDGATYDKSVTLDATTFKPYVTWGTAPDQSVTIDGTVPTLDDAPDDSVRRQWQRVYDYMGLTGGERVQDLTIDNVFIGSCTNARISDLRTAASIVAGKKVADGVDAIVVPGSGLVKEAAEAEGLHEIFTEAGFEWREPGCSSCLGMNPDVMPAGNRVASTSNRNFEGRQGVGARTHLMSPATAAASAIAGRITDARDV